MGIGCKQRRAGRTYAWTLTGQMKKPKGHPKPKSERVRTIKRKRWDIG